MKGNEPLDHTASFGYQQRFTVRALGPAGRHHVVCVVMSDHGDHKTPTR